MLKRILKRTFRLLLWVMASMVVFFIALVLLIRLPVVQNYITQKAVAYAVGKTHTRISLNRLYIGFPKSIVIEGLFAEDLKHDTLINLQKFEIDIDMLGLINQEIEINDLSISGLTSHIQRTLPDSLFNFDFFIKAFQPDKKEITEAKDTTSSEWKIRLNRLHFQNIAGNYFDEVAGMDMKAIIGELKLDMENMDLQNMQFHANKMLLNDAFYSLVMFGKTAAPDTTAVAGLLPGIGANKIEVNNVGFHFSDKESGILCDFNVGAFTVYPEEIDLNAQYLKANEIEIHKVQGLVAIKSENETEQKIITEQDIITQTDKGWKIEAEKFLADETNFRFDIIGAPKEKYGMDYSHMNFSNITMDVRDALYSDEKISADIRQISLHEKCGIQVNRFRAIATYDDKHASLKNLIMATPNSYISNYAEVSWNSLDDIAKTPGNLGFNIKMVNGKIASNEVLLFAPMLKDMPPFSSGKNRTVLVNGNIKGLLKDFTIDNLIVRTEETTAINLDAHVKGLPDAQTAYYDVKIKNAVTSKKEILKFVPAKSIPVTIPNVISLKGNFTGTFMHFNSNLLIESTSGNIQIEAKLNKVNNDTTYDIVLGIDKLDLGYLLQQPGLLGPVTLTTKVNGKNFSPQTVQANSVTEVKSLLLKGYTYRDIKLSADATQQKYAAALIINDHNIIMNMNGAMSTEEGSEYVRADLILEGADLFALKLTKDKIRTSGQMNIDLTGNNMENLTGRISLNKCLVIKNEKRYRVDSFLVASVNDKKHSVLTVKSGMLNIDYQGTLTLVNLNAAFVHHIDRYFDITRDEDVVRKDTSEQDFKLTVKVVPQPLLNEVLFPGLQKFNGADIIADFNNMKQQMNISVAIPVLEYKGNTLTNFRTEIHSNANEINYSIVLNSLRSGSLHLAQTKLEGQIKENNILFALNVTHKDSGNKVLVSGNMKQDEQWAYHLHLNERLVLNNTVWQIPADNIIRFKNGGIYANEFSLRNEQQLLSVRSDGENETAPLKITFKDFQLGTVSQVLEQDTAIVRGIMNGTFELRNIQSSPAFVSDLKISNIVCFQNPIGNISLQADNLSANKYMIRLILSGYENHVYMNGTYTSTTEQNLDVTIDVEKLNLVSIEPFTARQLRRSSGYVNGKIRITGKMDKPIVNGDIGFNNAAFNIAYINNYVQLKNERIRMDGEGIYFRSFEVLDSAGQKAVLNGTIHTSDLKK
jgi:hypothetical protein